MTSLEIRKIHHMKPSLAARYLQQNFDQEHVISELKNMLSSGGRLATLAHGISIELQIAENDELKIALKTSMKKANHQKAARGYGAPIEDNASEPATYAGKGPMYARMHSGEATNSQIKTYKLEQSQEFNSDSDSDS